jgi:hypothetical protein
MGRKLGEQLEPFLPSFSRIGAHHGRMSRTLDFALMGAITVFFWLVTQAWALVVLWAEARATRPASPAGPAGPGEAGGGEKP